MKWHSVFNPYAYIRKMKMLYTKLYKKNIKSV